MCTLLFGRACVAVFCAKLATFETVRVLSFAEMFENGSFTSWATRNLLSLLSCFCRQCQLWENSNSSLGLPLFVHVFSRGVRSDANEKRSYKCFAKLKPNSITLAGLELVRSWFEPDSVMEFGFY